MLRVPFNCTGCYACVSVCPKKCIVMKEDRAGFLFPMINTTECIRCNLCDKVCSVIHAQEQSMHTQAYAIKNRNDQERQDSTSGGIFSLLAKSVIDRNGIVFGAAYCDDFKVRHLAITDVQELSRLRGAKYTQSIIGDSLKRTEIALKSGRQVLFSGTPCQCSGLRAFLGKEYDNLLLVDLICHGVPSPKVWKIYLDYRSLKENGGIQPSRVNMRSKVSGWSRYSYSTEFDYGEGNITRIYNYQDLFMKAFVGNICLRKSCSNCVAKGVERCTDLTLGDYWGVWNQHPDFDDNKGTSIVLVHSEKGRKILQQLEDRMDCLEVDIDEAYKENMSLVKSSETHEKREEFLEKVNILNFEKLILEYLSPSEIKRVGFFKKIKGKVKGILNKNDKEL